MFKVLLPGLVAGGLCGAAVGFGLVPSAVGVVAAIVVGLIVGGAILCIRRQFKASRL